VQARAESEAVGEKDEIRSYAEGQLGEEVVHLEKVGSELVRPRRHDIWDVHCKDSRWWVLTNPTYYYDQADFKSRDVVLTFHVGLMIRVWAQQERRVPVASEPAAMLPGSWRRWQQAFEAYDGGDEAENFQAVGMRLRECLLSFVSETCDEELVPDGATPPKRGDFKNWIEVLAGAVARGPGAARLRSYLKKMSAETWEYVNWLTHAKNAIRMDAEIGLKMVEHLLGCFTASQMRSARISTRCAECESYRLVAGTCEVCGWSDPDYEPVDMPMLTEDEIAERLAEPCTPSSDISTFLSPEDAA
jgi:hypothetical protein